MSHSHKVSFEVTTLERVFPVFSWGIERDMWHEISRLMFLKRTTANLLWRALVITTFIRKKVTTYIHGFESLLNDILFFVNIRCLFVQVLNIHYKNCLTVFYKRNCYLHSKITLAQVGNRMHGNKLKCEEHIQM